MGAINMNTSQTRLLISQTQYSAAFLNASLFASVLAQARPCPSSRLTRRTQEARRAGAQHWLIGLRSPGAMVARLNLGIAAFRLKLSRNAPYKDVLRVLALHSL